MLREMYVRPQYRDQRVVYIAGEDNEVKLTDFGAVTFGSCWPVLDYFPSLAYIQPGGCLKKREIER